MPNKEFRDEALIMPEELREWQCFLGLLPLMNLQRSVDPVLYQRCLAAVWRLRSAETISERELRRAVGPDFQGQTANFDFLLAQLVRDQVLEPIKQSPYRFKIQRRCWTNPESVYAQDDRRSLTAITREEQIARLRAIQELRARIVNGRMSEKRAQHLREESDALQHIYDATWTELEDAIGTKACKVIRKRAESSQKACGQQLGLAFGLNSRLDLEGEGRCTH